MINWQLSKQGIRWPVSPARSAGSSVDPSRSSTLKLSADKLPVWNDRRLKFIFSTDSYQICCVYVTMALHCEDFDFKLTSEAKIHPVLLKVQAGKTLSYHGHALVTLYVRFLYSDWSKFDRWVYAEKLCSILKVVYLEFTLIAEADSVLCQLVMFLTVFFLWRYKMKYSCYQESSVIHGWFVYWVWLRNASLVKIR